MTILIPAVSALSAPSGVPEYVWAGASTSLGKIETRNAPRSTDSAGRISSGTRASAQGWIEQFRACVDPVRQLHDGWAGPGSRAVVNTVYYAVEHYLALALAGVTNPRLPYVVPAADGGLQLEWHREDAELEVLFSPMGKITGLFEDHVQGIEIEEEGDGAVNLLLRWAPRVAQADDHEPVQAPTSSSSVIALAA